MAVYGMVGGEKEARSTLGRAGPGRAWLGLVFGALALANRVCRERERRERVDVTCIVDEKREPKERERERERS